MIEGVPSIFLPDEMVVDGLAAVHEDALSRAEAERELQERMNNKN